MLKKEVCKKCRIDAYEDPKAWNYLAEAWFTGPAEQVHCPIPVIEKRIFIAKAKMKKALTKDEFTFLENSGILRFSAYQSPSIRPKSKPPWWCPYKKEHNKD